MLLGKLTVGMQELNAFYSPEKVGHFGLALEYYTHFTSPIRRYIDLIIQRLLFNQQGKDLDVEKIAQNSSEKERISFKAKSSVKLLKKLRLLEHWTKEDPTKIYEAIITRVKQFWIFFEIKHLMLEGFLHISELENDFFVYNPTQNALVGRSSGKLHKTGEVLHVRPVSIDMILLKTKWELIVPRKLRRK